MYPAPLIDPVELWRMPYEEFNKWRMENDFPRILKFFQEKLKGFNEWQNIFGLTDKEIIRSGIVDVIKPNKLVYFTTSFDKDNKAIDFISNKLNKVNSTYGQEFNDIYTIKVCKSFLPYLSWAKKKNIKIHPSSQSNRLSITRIEAVLVPDMCKVFMLNDLELLKLGGISNIFKYSLGGRKLDFVNLDFLNFEGKYYDSMGKNFSFSSCRQWKIKNSELYFFDFYCSNLEGMEIENSKIDAWNIDYCEGYDVKFKDSVLTRTKIKPGGFIPYFDNVDLRDSSLPENYLSDRTYGYSPNIELLIRFKNGFLLRGQHDVAGRYFYMEKYIKMKNDFREMILHLKRTFVPRNLFNKKVFKFNWMFHHFKKFLNYLLKWILGFLSWIWWGFGEKPSRVVLISFLMIIIGAVLISYSHNFHNYSSMDAIYYSVISFLTLGDSEFKPEGITRIYISVLALMGIFNLGLLIAGFVNKSKY